VEARPDSDRSTESLTVKEETTKPADKSEEDSSKSGGDRDTQTAEKRESMEDEEAQKEVPKKKPLMNFVKASDK